MLCEKEALLCFLKKKLGGLHEMPARQMRCEWRTGQDHCSLALDCWNDNARPRTEIRAGARAECQQRYGGDRHSSNYSASPDLRPMTGSEECRLESRKNL